MRFGMSDSGLSLATPVLAESGISYSCGLTTHSWVEVLVDCPGAQGLFTYALPPGLTVQPGDVLTVPFGAQKVGAIAIHLLAQLPPDLPLTQVREIEEVVSTGFFPATYWTLLNQVAEYYCTSLMAVIRVALPPGLLGRSQRRVRLSELKALDTIDLSQLSPVAQQVFSRLQAQKQGSYTWQYLQQKIPGAERGLRELLKQRLVESYLEPPSAVRPKLRQAVTLVATPHLETSLSPRQQEIIQTLQREGGDLWLSDLLQLCRTSSGTVQTLAKKGCIVIQPREILRAEAGVAIAPDQPKELTPDQAQALATITSLSGFAQVLLHGVTGSGKTEVYLQAIAPVLQRGQSALVLVPEIGLTPQLTDRFRARFGSKVCVYHSALSEGERYDTWRQMLSGSPQVVIGTRSAVFAPLPQLGLIILDEEHDSSFKQDQPAPCYHARTVAQWRAELVDCPLILGSATPSIETWVSAKASVEANSSGPHYLALPSRVRSRPLPPIEVVDMRQEFQQGNRTIFSRALQVALERLQERGQQGILFIHRRGHSTFVSCRSCGYVVDCPNCDVSLSYHHTHAEATQLLRCHYCNHTALHPPQCPECGSPYLKFFGSGTQRVTQELAKHLPDLRCLRFDSDTTRTKGSHRALLTQFAEGDADLLVGTQMLTKGIDLPQVTLVGVIAADGLLHLPDFRASERAFQTLTQVAGRAGRGDEPGQVIIQTYSPEHFVVEAVQHHEYEPFVAAELLQRQTLRFPPHNRLVLLKFSSPDPLAVQKTAKRIAAVLAPQQAESGYELLGPAPASILRVARRYRWQVLLKLPLDQAVELPDWNELRSLCPPNVSMTVDVDPLNLL
jgi:primosomal protein N' (replication factor Y)